MNKRDLGFGLLLFALMVLFFFIMKAAGAYENFNLRFINVLFHLGVTWLAIRKFYQDRPDREFNYLSGLMAGFRPVLVGIVLFAGFQMFYLSTDTHLMDIIKERAPMGDVLTPFTSSVYLLLEGVGVGLIASYLSMRVVDDREIPDSDYEDRL